MTILATTSETNKTTFYARGIVKIHENLLMVNLSQLEKSICDKLAPSLMSCVVNVHVINI